MFVRGSMLASDMTDLSAMSSFEVNEDQCNIDSVSIISSEEDEKEIESIEKSQSIDDGDDVDFDESSGTGILIVEGEISGDVQSFESDHSSFSHQSHESSCFINSGIRSDGGRSGGKVHTSVNKQNAIDPENSYLLPKPNDSGDFVVLLGRSVLRRSPKLKKNVAIQVEPESPTRLKNDDSMFEAGCDLLLEQSILTGKITLDSQLTNPTILYAKGSTKASSVSKRSSAKDSTVDGSNTEMQEDRTDTKKSVIGSINPTPSGNYVFGIVSYLCLLSLFLSIGQNFKLSKESATWKEKSFRLEQELVAMKNEHEMRELVSSEILANTTSLYKTCEKQKRYFSSKAFSSSSIPTDNQLPWESNEGDFELQKEGNRFAIDNCWFHAEMAFDWGLCPKKLYSGVSQLFHFGDEKNLDDGRQASSFDDQSEEDKNKNPESDCAHKKKEVDLNVVPPPNNEAWNIASTATVSQFPMSVLLATGGHLLAKVIQSKLGQKDKDIWDEETGGLLNKNSIRILEDL